MFLSRLAADCGRLNAGSTSGHQNQQGPPTLLSQPPSFIVATPSSTWSMVCPPLVADDRAWVGPNRGLYLSDLLQGRAWSLRRESKSPAGEQCGRATSAGWDRAEGGAASRCDSLSRSPQQDEQSESRRSGGSSAVNSSVESRTNAVSSSQLKFGIERILRKDNAVSETCSDDRKNSGSRSPSPCRCGNEHHLCSRQPPCSLFLGLSTSSSSSPSKTPVSTARPSGHHHPGQSQMSSAVRVGHAGSHSASDQRYGRAAASQPPAYLFPPPAEFPGPFSVFATDHTHQSVHQDPSHHHHHHHHHHQHHPHHHHQPHTPSHHLHGHHPTVHDTATASGSKRKRSWSRAVFSHLQRKGLEKRFEVQKYVTKPDRRQLAAMLGLTDAQVKVWFQNRRMKWRHAEEAKRKKECHPDIDQEDDTIPRLQAALLPDRPRGEQSDGSDSDIEVTDSKIP